MSFWDGFSTTVGIAAGIMVSAAIAQESPRLAEMLQKRLREMREEKTEKKE